MWDSQWYFSLQETTFFRVLLSLQIQEVIYHRHSEKIGWTVLYQALQHFLYNSAFNLAFN